MKTKEDYIRFKILKSEEALKQAELLLVNDFYEAAMSKLYYAAFYAISALLINRDLNPKTHLGAKSLFHKEFIHTGEIDKSYSDFYTMLMAKRFEVDYEYFSYINKEKVPYYLEETKKLINIVKQKLNLHTND